MESLDPNFQARPPPSKIHQDRLSANLPNSSWVARALVRNNEETFLESGRVFLNYLPSVSQWSQFIMTAFSAIAVFGHGDSQRITVRVKEIHVVSGAAQLTLMAKYFVVSGFGYS